MQRLVVRVLSGAVLAASLLVAVPPAQAAIQCDQRAVPNGRYNYCWGEPNPRQYRTEVWCRDNDRPLRQYLVAGPWRSYGTGNASVAQCGSNAHFSGDWGLNFR